MDTNLIFIDNKYTKWYYSIIQNAQVRNAVGYKESHHILPKSLGGTNSYDNLVDLTAREHFICHWLLTKMVFNKKHRYQMWNAFSCMLYRKNKNQERYKINSRIFENIKKIGAGIKSINFAGVSNPMFGKSHSEESKIKMSVSHTGKKKSVEARSNMSLSRLGKSKTESHKKSLKKSWEENREKRSGENSSWHGRTHVEETKEKIRQKILSMPLHTCEHCGKINTKGNYKRWHGGNCKTIQGELQFQS